MSEKLHASLLKRIAKNLKHYRKLAGLSQEDMRDFGFNYRHYQRMESGKDAMNTRTIARAAAALGIDPVKLFEPIKKS